MSEPETQPTQDVFCLNTDDGDDEVDGAVEDNTWGRLFPMGSHKNPTLGKWHSKSVEATRGSGYFCRTTPD